MTKPLLLIASCIAFALSANAQTTHDVSVANFSFTPADLQIEVGDIVRWTNISGQHSVDGNAIAFPNNPESFGNAIGPAGWVYEFTFMQVGTYSYRCAQHPASMLGSVTVIDGTLSVDRQLENKALRIFPNPANTYFTWELNNELVGRDLQLQLFNILGQNVLQANLSTINRINISNQESGIYFFQITEGSNVLQSGKLIVKH